MAPAILDVLPCHVRPGDRLSEGETVVHVRSAQCPDCPHGLGCTWVTVAEDPMTRTYYNQEGLTLRVARA